jgi:hypothetical protein
MKELGFDEDDDLKDLASEENDSVVPANNRYRIVVEFVVKADSVDDAEQDVKDIIDYGIIGMVDNEDREPVRSFDVIESGPDEL